MGSGSGFGVLGLGSRFWVLGFRIFGFGGLGLSVKVHGLLLYSYHGSSSSGYKLSRPTRASHNQIPFYLLSVSLLGGVYAAGNYPHGVP